LATLPLCPAEGEGARWLSYPSRFLIPPNAFDSPVSAAHDMHVLYRVGPHDEAPNP